MNCEARQNPGRKPAFDEKQLRRLRRIVERHPDATLRELKGRMGVTVADGTMLRALGKLKLTLKKSHFMPQNRRVRT